MTANNFSAETLIPVNANDAVLHTMANTLVETIQQKEALMKEVSLREDFNAAVGKNGFEAIADKTLGQVLSGELPGNLEQNSHRTLRDIFNDKIEKVLPERVPEHYPFFQNPIGFFMAESPLSDLAGYRKLDELCEKQDKYLTHENVKLPGETEKKSVVTVHLSRRHIANDWPSY